MIPRRLAALLVCHNRRALTLAALASLTEQALPAGLSLDIILVDDGSTDGTAEAVTAAFPTVTVLRADGTLYWNGAMTLAQTVALATEYDFHLWLNDDVRLFPGALTGLIALHDAEQAAGHTAPIVVGAMVDPDSGQPTYGAQARRPGWHPFRFQRVSVRGVAVRCDTFNGNCVLVPGDAARRLGPVDPAFSGGQPLGDTDYGLRAGQAGVPILLAPDPAGTCRGNDRTSPWRQRGRPLLDRLSLLRGPLGPLRRQTVIFYRRHGGGLWPLWLAVLCTRMTLQALFPAVSGGRPRLAMIEPVLPWYRVGLLQRLQARGRIGVTLFHGSAHRQGEPASPVPPGIDHRYARSLHWPGGRGRVLWNNTVWRLLTGRYDVVLMPEHIFTASNWLVWLISQIAGRPRLILTGHFTSLGRSDWGRGLRRLWVRSADYLAPYTPSGARQCLDAGVPEHRIQILYNTLPVEGIRAVARPSQPDRPPGLFLFIGRLYPQKRVGLAVAAVEDLCRRGIGARLLVVGDGEELADLRARAQAGAPVDVFGPCRDAGILAGLFAQAEAVILPDSAGLAVVQAFAFGVPVILGPGQCHGVEAEYVRDGENGLWAGALTAAALADRMQQMLTDAGLAARLRAGAVATADGLGLEAYTERLERVVETAARV